MWGLKALGSIGREVEFKQYNMKTKNIHKLTNRDISEQYRDYEFWLMPSNFLGAFSYWVASQNGNKTFVVDKPLEAFYNYIKSEFNDVEIPEMFKYERLNRMIDEDAFKKIPEIMELNEMKPDFIDLYALARNVFYMICREQITQPL